MQQFIKNILSFFVALLILGGNYSYTQVKVQVVTQKISKSINREPGMALWIQAERAEVYCTTHASNTIELDVEFIAKNESRKAAEADLKKMKWVNETIGKKVFLRNYIELERNESRPESDIKVVYHIKLPANCAVNIKNYFGKIDVENLNFELTINSEFSEINLQNISGKTTIKTTFGDVSARAIDGDIRIESKRSDIDLSDISGSLKLHSILANIALSGMDNIVDIKIDAEKSKVNIKTGDFNNYFFQFELRKAEFKKPDNMKLDFTTNEKETVKASFNNSDKHPQISVKLDIGALTIEP